MKRLMYSALVLLSAAAALSAAERIAPKKAEVKTVKVRFSGDYISAFYVLLDVRTDEEKARNRMTRSLDGPVIAFFQGHMYRPDTAFDFTSNLAIKSKSGIVVIPVCDTPNGKDEKTSGDNAKIYILMEVLRYALKEDGIDLDGYKPATDKEMAINEKPVDPPKPDYSLIPAKLAMVGYSHGGILSRRLASTYPDITLSLAHVHPAGYFKWGVDKSCTGPFVMFTTFVTESACLSFGVFRGEGKYIVDAGIDGTKGLLGDGFRSCSSCMWGSSHTFNPVRLYDDGINVGVYLDDNNAPVPGCRNVVVIFGRNDWFSSYKKVDLKNPDNISELEKEAFWTKFYPGNVKNGSKLTLKVLPGNHIGFSVNNKLYSEEILRGIGQYREK